MPHRHPTTDGQALLQHPCARHFETGENFCAAQTQRQERQADDQADTAFPEQVAELAMVQLSFVREVIVHCALDHGMRVRIREEHLQMHDQSNWLIEWIFRSPTHDEFLKVVVEILFVKRRRSIVLKNCSRSRRLTSIVFSRRRVVEGETGDFEVFIVPMCLLFGDPPMPL